MNEQPGAGGGRLQAGSGPGPGGKGAERVIPFGKYLLLDRIAVGGMAEVYTAKSFGVEGFEKILAIKRILPTMAEDEDFIQMFIDEAKIAGQLTHANIVPIYELGKIGDSHYIAMEYVWGKDLLQIMNRFRKMRKQMPPSMGAWIGAKMCEGLDYAHRKKDRNGRPLGIIHRDVSPQNCLVSYEGQVKMIDFGIAKAASRNTKTQAGVLKGKFGYMSPEQVRGLPIDHRSDIFAVGTCLYEMLTTERLFVGESDFSTLEKVRNAQVPALSLQVPDIPKELEDIVMKALARDAADRWQSAAEMQEALQRFIARERPPFGTSKLAAWMRTAFAPEMAKEKQRLDSFAKVGPPPPAPAPARPAPALRAAPPPEDQEPAELAGEATVMTASPFESMGSSESAGDIQEQATQIFFSAEDLQEDEGSRPTVAGAPVTAQPAPPPRVGAGVVSAMPRPVGMPPPMRPQPMVPVSGPVPSAAYPSPSGPLPPAHAAQPAPTLPAVAPPAVAPPPGVTPLAEPAPARPAPEAPQQAFPSVFEAPPPQPKRTDTMQLQAPPLQHPAVARVFTGRTALFVGVATAGLAMLGVGLFAGYSLFVRGPGYGTIEVRTLPAEAATALVVLDGQPRGRAPIRIEGVVAGEHTLVLSQPGFQDLTRTVTVADNGTVSLDVALSPASPSSVSGPGTAVAAAIATAVPGATTPPVPEQPVAGTPTGAALTPAPAPTAPTAVPPPAAATPAPTAPTAVPPPAAATPAPTAPTAVPPPTAATPAPTAPTAVSASTPAAPGSGGVPDGSRAESARASSGTPASSSPASTASTSTARPRSEPQTATQQPEAGSRSRPVPLPSTTSGSESSSSRPRQVPASAAAPAAPTTPQRVAPAPSGQGTLMIQTLPWARVFLDGRDTGRNTPVRELRVPAGTHTIGLRTADGRMTEVTVQVAPNEVTRVVRQL